MVRVNNKPADALVIINTENVSSAKKGERKNKNRNSRKNKHKTKTKLKIKMRR